MFSGTTLITDISLEQLNRAILDLLNKINELSRDIDNSREKINDINARIKELENA